MNQSLIYCPVCKNSELIFDSIKKYHCPACGWEFFQNTAAAVAGILEYKGKTLAVVRNREPGKGLLDFPGGFVDPDESAEEALAREIKEELNIDIGIPKYLCSAPNFYRYKNIDYTTCDIFFTVQLDSDKFELELSEISGYKWFKSEELDPEDFAFRSMKVGIAEYKNSIKKPG